MTNKQAADLATLENIASAPGGQAIIGGAYLAAKDISSAYAKNIKALTPYPFWTAGDDGDYRPTDGLWAPQRKAVALSMAYLIAQKLRPADGLRESALIKMPTGTGKSGVIATLSCCAPDLKRILVLTPRSALVEQMIADISWRFWKRFGLCFLENGFNQRSTIAPDDLEKIESGQRKPVHRLRHDGYQRIWSSRHQERQVIVGTFNALQAVLALEPPAHRSSYGRVSRLPALAFTPTAEDPDPISIDGFRAMLKDIDLVIVDEGHYEPAYAWSQCVEHINAPTLIFSATPYRNDFKYFNMRGNFAFNLPFHEAVEQKLIRDVSVASIPPGPARAKSQTKPAQAEIRRFVEFVRQRCDEYGTVPEGRPVKCIVHAATYSRLAALQREFYRQDKTLRPILIHDRQSGPPETQNRDLVAVGERARKALAEVRFQHVKDASDPAGPGPNTKIWLHQYKLLEGVDNADFRDVFLFDGFTSARQVIQQVGRALRYSHPTRTTIEKAHVFGADRRFDRATSTSIGDMVQAQWRSYLDYERYAASDSERAFTAETQLLNLLKKTAPDVQYIGGEFRKGFFKDDDSTMADYVLPRRAVICYFDPQAIFRSDEDPSEDETPQRSPDPPRSVEEALDRLATLSAEAMKLEERFDIRIVPPPSSTATFTDVRLIRYLAWSNSKLLHRRSLPEWKLGLMAIVRAGELVFIVDTEGVCVDYDRLGLASPTPLEMKRLFSDPRLGSSREKVRIVEASTMGLDLSDIAVRSMTVRKRDLGDGYFDLAEAAQAPSTLHGIAMLGEKTVRRQLSIRTGRVSDPTSRNISLEDYSSWARVIAEAITDTAAKQHPFFNRFALEVPPPAAADGKAYSLLLDLWELLDTDDTSFQERDWSPDLAKALLDADLCLEGQEIVEAGKRPKWVFKLAGKYEITVEYAYKNTIPPRARYRLRCRELDDDLTASTGDPDETTDLDDWDRPRRFGASLMALVNRNQCFRIIPRKHDIVYVNGVFFNPSINWDAIVNEEKDNLLDVITVCPTLADCVSEKGEAGVTSSNWRSKSQFGWIDAAFNSSSGRRDELQSILAKSDLLVCDDGSTEICDFFCLDEKTRTIALIHAKTSDGVGRVAVSSLQIVGRQASASLAFIGSSRSSFRFPAVWNKPLEIREKKTKTPIKTLVRVQSKKSMSARDSYDAIVAALRDPKFHREVWVVTSGILSKSAAIKHLADAKRDRSALQFAYYLADLRTAFARASTRLRIFTGD